MKAYQFRKYLALYGADLSRWPQHEIKAAVDLIQRDPDAGEAFSAAEKLDQMLRHYPRAAVDMNALTGRIVRAKRGVSRARLPVMGPAYLFASGGGLLVVAILGFMVGFHGVHQNKETYMLDSVLYAQDHVLDSEEVS